MDFDILQRALKDFELCTDISVKSKLSLLTVLLKCEYVRGIFQLKTD